MSSFRILEGDCETVLASLEPASVQTCITSPPYWGLRDYGTAEWVGGDAACDHKGPPKASAKSGLKNDGRPEPGRKGYELAAHTPFGATCGKCGAERVDDQLGLEPTPEEYVERLVSIFRGVRRALRDDGTLWLNLGDTYAATSTYNAPRTQHTEREWKQAGVAPNAGRVEGVKPKDLVGIPWMVAFALRADGWYLRSDIIWAKPNPMPESVTDRPTKAHEYLFLLSKGPRYFYDADAVREDGSENSHGSPRVNPGAKADAGGSTTNGHGATSLGKWTPDDVARGRNRRSVWTVTTQPFTDAHFATFPPKLIEPCILAGSKPEGAMIEPEMIETPVNGQRKVPAGWDTEPGRHERIHREGRSDPTLQVGRAGMSRPRQEDEGTVPMTRAEQAGYAEQLRRLDKAILAEMIVEAGGETTFAHYVRTDRAGARPIPPELLERWISSGRLEREVPPAATAADPATSVVLDPFSGAGTTGLVALRHNRRYVGIELNPEYAEMARRRILDDAPLLNHEEVAA